MTQPTEDLYRSIAVVYSDTVVYGVPKEQPQPNQTDTEVLFLYNTDETFTPIAPGMCFRVEDATYDDLHLDTDFVEEGQFKIVGWWDGEGESALLQEIVNSTNPPALAFHRLVKNLAGVRE